MSAIIATGIVPAALEMIDRPTIRAVESSIYAAGYPTDAAAALLIEVDGARAGLEADVAPSSALCREPARAACASRATTPSARGSGRDARRRSARWGASRSPSSCRTRSSRARSCPRCSPRSRRSARGTRITVCNVFHAGDGNLHPNIPYDGSDPDEARARARGDARDHGRRASRPAARSPASTASASTSSTTWT